MYFSYVNILLAVRTWAENYWSRVETVNVLSFWFEPQRTRYGWIGERLALDRKHSQKKKWYHQYERREAVQQQPNILFVTGKYCIYIPSHCFQFAYVTQSLVFIWIQICMKKMYEIIVFCFLLLLCYIVKWAHWYYKVKSKNDQLILWWCIYNMGKIFINVLKNE